VHMIGMLYIGSVTGAEACHDTCGHHHHEPNPLLLGSYHHAVFGNKSGHTFFDIIFREDTVARMLVAPQIRNEQALEKIEDILQQIIESTDNGTPPEHVTFSDTALNMKVDFKPAS